MTYHTRSIDDISPVWVRSSNPDLAPDPYRMEHREFLAWCDAELEKVQRFRWELAKKPCCGLCDGPLLTERDREYGAHTETEGGYSCYVRLQEMAE